MSDRNARDKNGNAPIHLAVSAGHDSTAETLLDAGADATIRRNRDGAVTLQLAVAKKRIVDEAMVSVLLQVGVEEQPSMTMERLPRICFGET